MAKSKDKRSARLYSLRLKELRLARRAMRRRRKLLRKGDKKGAYNALRVARRHRRKAQGLLALRRERRRALLINRKLLRHRRAVRGAQGLQWFDGKQVPTWIVEELKRARKAGWRGYVVSGYRTPAYSEQLCYGMCGAPRCSGMCAGRSSNHSQGYVYPHGAVDVTDYYNLAAVAQRLGLRIRNRLPRDRVHFSSSGV